MPGSGEAADMHRLTFLYMLAILDPADELLIIS